MCAVVVTFNRLALLEECLDAIGSQTCPPAEVMVVDNASTDGTAARVAEKYPHVLLRTLPENSGAAGGFSEALDWGYRRGHDWVWAMDDDTIPHPGALEALFAGLDRAPDPPPLLLSSRVEWSDGELHPMNRPTAHRHATGALGLGAQRGLLLLRSTTWVSTLFSRAAIEDYGLPQGHFFMWTEDIEYTTRILRDHPGYMVPESRVEHRTKTGHTFLDAAPDRFYLHVRNYLLTLRGSGYVGVERAAAARWYANTLVTYLVRHRFGREAVTAVARGVSDGVRGATR